MTSGVLNLLQVQAKREKIENFADMITFLLSHFLLSLALSFADEAIYG